MAGGNPPFRNSYEFPPIADALRTILRRRKFDLVHLISGYLLGAQTVQTAHEVGLPVAVTLTEFWFMCPRLNLIQPSGALCTGPEYEEKCVRCLDEDKRRYAFLRMISPRAADVYWGAVSRVNGVRKASVEIARRRTVLQTALDAADLVISPSRHLILQYERFGFDTRQYVFLRQGLASPTGSEMHAPKPGNGPVRLGYVGQIKPHKGVDLLIEAVCDLVQGGHRVTLDVWGSETEAPEYVAGLKRRSASMSGTIRWNGRYLGNQVWDVLRQLDALVVPSRWYENSPNAILEAYAAGLPVVAANIGGMAELVMHDKSGLLFDVGNAESLRRQLARLKEEPLLLSRLRQGLPAVKSLDEEMSETLSHYARLAGC
jgi:glycosyltransferase involved in cell wall biosynthesis